MATCAGIPAQLSASTAQRQRSPAQRFPSAAQRERQQASAQPSASAAQRRTDQRQRRFAVLRFLVLSFSASAVLAC